MYPLARFAVEARGRRLESIPSLTRSISCPGTESVFDEADGKARKTSFFRKEYWRFYGLRNPLSKYWVAARASHDRDGHRSSSCKLSSCAPVEDWASSSLSPRRSLIHSDECSVDNDAHEGVQHVKTHGNRRSMQFISVEDLFRAQVEPVKRCSSMSTLEENRDPDDHLAIIREGSPASTSDLPMEPCDIALATYGTLPPAKPISVPHLAAASIFGGPPVVTPNIEWQRAHMPVNFGALEVPATIGLESAYVANLFLHCMLGGEYMAPLKNPRTILDVSYREGVWIQLVFHETFGDLPIAEHSVDYIHQHFKTILIQNSTWERHLRNLRRVLRPGKYLELVEVDMLPTHVGPGSCRLVQMMRRLLQSRGIDPEMPRKLEPLLKHCGFQHVERLDVNVPIGEWGGPGGAMMQWLVDVVILMARRAIVDDDYWTLLDSPPDDELNHSPSSVATSMSADHYTSTYWDDNGSITANEFDALWDITRQEMAVNSSYSTLHIYLAR
ncbi:hypothetical protein SYNPS1DRAFT_23112 [Syncephalis pseudoplumigaleata]|uniref:Methyltransferase domain-containing protein n=1 Tax=Syncephalis pseudoplumigaleata TaxID=1712513 RepID=A0A4P9YZ31_9FUNG|nr:hypothetical protein SYNPS1DRAFT_23112 [Syncephalis pseudoplumigaleata]|eukprot:RKP24842.1 hypothetical protein SYNPS1DRAFT_23112 [Syncephalis pseudoplumigaleata]